MDRPVRRLVATTVVRGARPGEAHGAVYLVDLATGTAECTLECSDVDISWTGAGGDRGLRGIVATGDRVYVARASAVDVYDRSFERVAEIRNPYLMHVKEVALLGGLLWLVAAGCDSLLAYDTTARRFVTGICLRENERGKLVYEHFDPESPSGPDPVDTIHLNNVVGADGGLYASARDRSLVLAVEPDGIRRWATIPLGTHNPRPYENGIIYNDTRAGLAVRHDGSGRRLAEYRPGPFPGLVATEDASPGFVRGLWADDNVVVVGSSPASLWLFDVRTGELLERIDLAEPMHHAVHSVSPWDLEP